MYVAESVHQAFGLFGDSSADAGVRVTGVGHAKRRGQIDETVAVDVPDVRSRSPLPEDGRLGIDADDVATFDGAESLRERARARSGDGGRKYRGEIGRY